MQTLTATDLREIYSRLGRIVGVDQPLALDEIRERRFAQGRACPHCRSERVQRHGKYRYMPEAFRDDAHAPQRYRYRCLACRRTFNDLTATPLDGMQRVDRYPAFLSCMARGMTVRKTAREIGVQPATAFYWRHKTLAAFRAAPLAPLQGITEADETFFLESQKGTRRMVERAARRHGARANRPGLGGEQVCVAVARDRLGHTVARMAGYGKPDIVELEGALRTALGGVTVLCTDAHRPYATLAERHHIEHIALNASRGERSRGIYHLQGVNGYHGRLKKFIGRFNGVADRYMDHYLEWFNRYDGTAAQSMPALVDALFRDATLAPVHVRNDHLAEVV